MKNILYLLILIFLIQPLGHSGWFDSKETKEKLAKKDEPDYLTLATLMIRDGHYDRAEAILLGLNTKEEGFNLIKYYTLRGLIGLNKTDYKASQEHFLNAINAAKPNVDYILYVYIAQVYYADQNFERTLWALSQAGEFINDYPNLLGIKATCNWSLGKQAEAFAVLANADSIYPEKSDFKIRRIYYLIEMQLYKEAVVESEEFLKRFGIKGEAYLIVGEALRRSRNFPAALNILEKGHLFYPTHEKLLLSLAHTYMMSGKNIAAAKLFEKASASDPKYLEQAIGLYRSVGNTWKAKYLNAQVGDSNLKLKNWMEILLEEENYEEILAIEERLNRYGVLKDDKLRYAMAYVHFINENFSASENYLKGISDPAIFKNSVKLLEAIEVYKNREKI